MTGTRYFIEVRPTLPPALARLEELANDLMYTWDRDLRRLFRYLDNALYEDCKANLKLFLRQVAQSRLDEAAADPAFLRAYHRVLSAVDTYRQRQLPPTLAAAMNPEKDLIAYFCFEFGFHESLPFYSGGLGILAADHCKAASDLAIPLVGVGLMYHEGFFVQEIDSHGRQQERYVSADIDALPVELVHDDEGEELRVSVPIADRTVRLRIWRADVGNARLYLLDSDISANEEPYRGITRRLYDGQPGMRIQQEAVLGIGGVRALRALGINPSVWHLNEGHAAFLVLERIREHLAEGRSLDVAVERTATATVFTTHTPVSAGHDVFDWQQVEHYLGRYLADAGIEVESLQRIGHNSHTAGLNMTALALRVSRICNGVSRIHRDVAAANERSLWPEIPPSENPFSYVTNGVHLQTFLALEWVNQFDMRFGDWRSNLNDVDYWQSLDAISDHQFWSVRTELKQQLLHNVAERLRRQHRRNGVAESTIERLTGFAESGDVLVLGFARRFATYKRATLMFSDLPRLARLLNDPDRPVIIIMAGKAHPHDEEGKRLIEEVFRISMKPEFIDRVHLVENYDVALARALVAGVDVWLNTPEHPLEASGTSGMKAAINGALNLSVLDGWWAEAYDGRNGWAIKPHDPSWDRDYRLREEASDLLELLERSVIPTYFERREVWIRMAKHSMRTIIPRFNAERMVHEYAASLYGASIRQSRRLTADGGQRVERLAAWKHRVRAAWPGVTLERQDEPPSRLQQGEAAKLRVGVQLNGLAPEDVRVECVVDNALSGPAERRVLALAPTAAGTAGPQGIACYGLDFTPPFSGSQSYRLRAYPCHDDLAHPFEMGCMKWA